MPNGLFMKKLVGCLLIGLLLGMVGCNGSKKGDEFEVKGTLQDYPNGKVYLDRVIPKGYAVVDSTETDGKGNFSLRHGDSPNIFNIRLSNNQSMLLFPERSTITVTANAGQLSAGTATGNGATASLQAFSKRRNSLRGEFARESNALKSLNRNYNPQGWQEQEAKADRAMKAYREYVRAYADTVPQPALAWYAVSNLHMEGDFYYVQQFVEERKAKGEKGEWLDHLESETIANSDDFLRFEATDFISADAKGDSVALSDSRGKVTYLFIWASYCGLSRMEAQRLAVWKHEHPDVPIEILTFSIDDDDKAWRTALVEDSLDWPGQLRGLMSWSSPEIQQFAVDNIPVTFILDAKGIIRTKNAHAMDLEQDYAEMVAKWGK
jgi:hypothetical protein